jgi:uncharacterized iron-regulated membrane protein
VPHDEGPEQDSRQFNERRRRERRIDAAFWRQWHRWIGWVATAFLLFAAVTGVIVAGTEFFGEEEALREATRDVVSPVTTADAHTAQLGLAAALETAAREASGRPIDQITLRLKGPQPNVSIYLGKPGGGEDRRLDFDLSTGSLLRTSPYIDKPLINRIHSGEAFGDGGLVAAMLWGLALIVVTVTGIVIYWSMRRRNATGLERYFW